MNKKIFIKIIFAVLFVSAATLMSCYNDNNDDVNSNPDV